jgi:hypothetical protein
MDDDGVAGRARAARRPRRGAVPVALLAIGVLALGCTSGESAGDQAAAADATSREAVARPAPAPDPAPESEPGPDTTERHGPSTGDVGSGDASIRRVLDGVRSTFLDEGTEAGMAALAGLTGQQLSVDELLACLLDGVSSAELDGWDHGSDWRWEYLLRDEGWEAFGRGPSDDAWRLYLVDSTVTIAWTFEGPTGQTTSSGTAHVAVSEDDEVTWYPACPSANGDR